VAVHGIGRLTADIFLIFYLVRPDVLPMYRARNMGLADGHIDLFLKSALAPSVSPTYSYYALLTAL
jgi:hypothetical protein